jgi:hypothetical protein
MASPRKLKCVLGIASCGLAAVLVQASVFQTGGREAGNLFTPSTFGRCLYQAVMLINGGRADVSVVACEAGEEAIRDAFRIEEKRGTGRYFPGDSLGLGKAAREGQTLGLVTLKPLSRAPSLMVAVSQSDGEVRAARSARGIHRIDEVPIPSGSRVLSSLKNLDTRTDLETLSIRMPAEGVRAFYDAGMLRNGWSRLFPAAREGEMLVYVKGANVCCLGISAADLDGDTRVTLLHKQGAVK